METKANQSMGHFRHAKCGTQLLYNGRLFIVLFWVIALCFGIWLGPKFLARTTNPFNAPQGSLADIAQQEIDRAFHKGPSLELSVFIKSTDNSSVLDDTYTLQNLTFALNQTVYSFPGCAGKNNCVEAFFGYSIFVEKGFPESTSGSIFVSPDNTSTFILIQLNLPPTDIAFVKWLEPKLIPPLDKNWTVSLTGIAAFIPVMQEGIEQDLAVMDGIVLPLALIVLAFILKSFRLLILPLCAMGISAFVSFMALYSVTYWMDIISVAPSIMMSLMVAMNFDYSLFLLSRYREELTAGADTHGAVQGMVETAGYTIFVSGITLACCFLGMAAIPISLMQALGVACSVTLMITLAVNLTFIPSFLLLFPNFFERSVEPFYCWGKLITWGVPDNPFRVPDTEDEFLTSRNSSTQSVIIDSHTWYTLGKGTLTFPYNFLIIILVIAIVAPFSAYVYPYESSNSLEMMLPRGAPSAQAYHEMGVDFGLGVIFPYKLLFVPSTQEVMTEEFFGEVEDTVNTLVQHLFNTTTEAFSGFAYSHGVNTWNFLEFCQTSPWMPHCNMLAFFETKFLNAEKNATFLIISLPFDPLGTFGKEWYFAATNITQTLSMEKNISITLSGLPAASACVIQYVENRWVTMILITIGVVLLFVAIAFRSCILPFRSVFTIALTIIWVYGFADLVFERGIFNFLHFSGLQGYGAIHWSAPILSFSVVVGLGLDYDVFLLTRIKELRDSGFDTKDSIALGLSKTGHIITAAGVIMAIAFSGLIFSRVPLMNMFSFYLVFAVLFDTFIVRSLLAPAIMGCFGDYNWWPGAIPAVNAKVERTYPQTCGPFWAPSWYAKPERARLLVNEKPPTE